MKRLSLALAFTVLGTAAFAQDATIIRKEEPASSTTIVKERSDATVVQKDVTTGSVGCSSKTVSKTDEFGDTKVKQKTEC